MTHDKVRLLIVENRKLFLSKRLDFMFRLLIHNKYDKYYDFIDICRIELDNDDIYYLIDELIKYKYKDESVYMINNNKNILSNDEYNELNIKIKNMFE